MAKCAMADRREASLRFEAQYVFNVPTAFLRLARCFRPGRVKKALWFLLYPWLFKPDLARFRRVDPRDIARAVRSKAAFRRKLDLMGTVRWGEWDRDVVGLEELPRWQDMEGWLRGERTLDECQSFREGVRAIEEGRAEPMCEGCDSVDSWRRKWERMR
ncbi:MAG: hypothetical protein ACYS1C_11510, partial [Planctomycetota bacterium]